MTEVGIRELRDHLSRYLDRVQDGEEVVVTDRGRAIARVLDLIVVAGDRALLAAADAVGLSVAALG